MDLNEVFLPEASLSKIFPVTWQRAVTCTENLSKLTQESCRSNSKYGVQMHEFYLHEAQAQLQMALFGMDEAEWEKVQEERRRRLAAKELVVMPSPGSAQSQQSEARQNTTEMKEDDQKARVEATADQVQAKAAAWARQEMAALFGVSGEVTQETKAANKSKTSVEGQIKAGAETMEDEGACSDAKAGVAQKSVSPPEELLHPKEFPPGGADRVGRQK